MATNEPANSIGREDANDLYAQLTVQLRALASFHAGVIASKTHLLLSPNEISPEKALEHLAVLGEHHRNVLSIQYDTYLQVLSTMDAMRNAQLIVMEAQQAEDGELAGLLRKQTLHDELILLIDAEETHAKKELLALQEDVAKK